MKNPGHAGLSQKEKLEKLAQDGVLRFYRTIQFSAQ